ncbi:hypothetical protein [Xanthocytophaga agilis]|uniref:Uncharacterized protein n=1 Tax=Xanthocytophaga agilis TaxID=3048010 RepID=A0AAE3RBK9_9BACT|nr:hypothetical protein [Xanthocytophaga agilis]MDJ1505225.1 hypothetical protein [Xanthocytophaga agilis]
MLANLFQSSLPENLTQTGLKTHIPYSNKYLWGFVFLFLSQTVSAQQTVGGLTQIVEQIKLVANVLFIGAIVWAAVRTVLAFAGGSPNAMGNAMQTILIAIFWFGFNYFVEDIASSLGGAGAGDYNR